MNDLHFGLYKRGNLEASRVFRRSKDLIGVLLRYIGESFDDHFFAIKLSVMRRSRNHAADEDR